MKLEQKKGMGPKKLQLLSKLGIATEEELVEYYPFRYEIIKRSNLEESRGEKVIIDGIIESAPKVFYIRSKLNKLSFTLNTGTYLLTIVLFNRAYLKQHLKIGSPITVIGKIDKNLKNVSASEIRFGLIEKEYIEPVYHTTLGISNKVLETMIKEALNNPFTVMDYIPEQYQQNYHFIDKKQSIFEIHHPSSVTRLKEALTRAKYEELFLFMMKMNELKENKNTKIGLKREIEYSKVQALIDELPYPLTPDQLKSVEDIYHDLTSSKRMNRLLQGDVGSGKTIVAILAMYMNYLSGYQSCLMAPTEILASQHYETIGSLLKEKGIHIELLTGKMKVKEKREIYEKIRTKQADMIIGTHALFTEDVVYNNLGLVITDEQHRFGVNQRKSLKNKGITPDVLYMSATPIPRTYALTLYGDMDISSIKTIPNGRKEIITTLKKEKEIKEVLNAMLEQLKLKHQIYVIAPLIEESDKMDLENVTTLEEKMQKAFGKYFHISVLHGKMSSKEKDEVMTAFANHEIDILISTTVIEVGINVPNATMMVIFDSYRFGLAALHQLRGRVGRGSDQSYCILISNYETERLKILTQTNDGFKISEEDFKLRGSGDLFGLRQSGVQVFKIADFKEDYDLVKRAKEDSEKYFHSKDFENNKQLKDLLATSSDLN